MSDRQGVDIDHCPQCRGVWLDRGELDKLIERAAGSRARPRPDDDHEGDERSLLDFDGLGRQHSGDGRKRRRRGLLDDLFDFD